MIYPGNSYVFFSGKWWGSVENQPVIAMHGWQDNAGTFDKLAPLLCNDISLLCIDYPGHGHSSCYPKGQYYYLFWDGIHLLRRVIKHYGWTDVKLIGHSLGGSLSFLYAACFPKEVDCYVSIDIASPSVRDPVELVSAIGEHVDRFLKYETMHFDSFPGYTREEAIEIAYQGYEGSCTKESCEILMKRGTRLIEGKTDQYHFTRDPRLKVPALGFMTFDQVMEFASRITCRVLNIKGDPGMALHDPLHYKQVLDKIEEKTQVVRVVVPGTHHLHLNNPEPIAEHIREFLLNN